MKICFALFILIFGSFHNFADEPNYKSEIFKTDSASSGAVICLYLGHEFSFADDTPILFNQMMDKFDISRDLRDEIMKDAKNYWAHNLTQFDMGAEALQKKYWDLNCEEATKKMRLYFSHKGSADET